MNLILLNQRYSNTKSYHDYHIIIMTIRRIQESSEYEFI